MSVRRRHEQREQVPKRSCSEWTQFIQAVSTCALRGRLNQEVAQATDQPNEEVRVSVRRKRVIGRASR
jgi:hypothetical protein